MRQLIQSTVAYAMLRAEIENNKLNHTCLLIFDDARNLRFALKEFAKLYFEKNERVSGLIDSESFSDCIILPENGKKFSVEDSERIREESALKPVEGDKKLFVIGDIAEATVQAQNKLLKLLEEPPEGVYFLLGATIVFPVLPTVLSRAQKLEISPASPKEEEAYLKRLYPGLKNAQLYVAASGGSVGVAQNIIDGGYYNELMQGAFELIETDPFRLPAVAKRIGETKYKKELLSLMRSIYRDALILKTARLGGSEKSGEKDKKRAMRFLLLQSEAERLLKISEAYRLQTLLYAQNALSEAEKQVRFNAVFSQCLEICMANILGMNNR